VLLCVYYTASYTFFSLLTIFPNKFEIILRARAYILIANTEKNLYTYLQK
jgi:hypothetical protein